MEQSADGCATGILIDFGDTKISKGNKVEGCTESLVEEEMNIKSSHLGTVDSIQSQNINSSLFSEKEMCHISKPKWSTPSPQSMKIISHEASRIIDKLSISTEEMLCDEVFPAIKSLDDGCFDELNSKSEKVSVTDNFIVEKKPEDNLLVNQNISVIEIFNDPHVKSEIALEKDNFLCDKMTENSPSFCEDMSKSKFGRNNSPVEEIVSDCSTASYEKQLATPSKSKMIAEVKLSFISEEMPKIPLISENVCKKELVTALVLNKDSNKKTRHITSIVDGNPTIFEGTETLDNHSEREPLVQVKQSLGISKGFGFKSSKKRYVEGKNESLMPHAGNKFLVNEIGLKKTEKTSILVENELKELKISDKVLETKPFIERTGKSIAALSVPLENRKGKSVMNTSQNYLPKEAIGKHSYKSNVQLQPFSRSKQPLSKSASMKLGTPTVQSVRRSNSFQTQRGKNSIPTVEKKSTSSAISSSSRVLKPRMSLSVASNDGKGLSNPLRFGANFPKAKSFNLATPNPNRRASDIYFSSEIKVPVPNIRNSTLQNPVFSTSSRSRFSSRLDRPSPLPGFMNDNLAKKLF
ncbi:uncharacterized protein TNIN_429241 [Trichonephila inaurata madagascariensis]|uniref:Uncharacterized protein n=1 Tax=Trichonephila inaurata madagascariensis TaxID=2747483 RepID=A0A8X6J8C4_9ARAC|nr:uncharacterized protein TNIN_429241 [Trichonephila inaurata madagascariensis]